MKRRFAAALPALAAVAISLPLTLATPAMASAPCGSGASDKDSTSWQSTAGNGTNQRSGSSTSCIVTGVAYANHNLDYHCYTRVSSTETWTYLRNDATNVYGWIRDDKLSDGGSFNAC